MRQSEVLQLLKSRNVRAAWFVAIVADSIQIVLLPLFVAGGLSPAVAIVDFAAAWTLSRLLGWHWAFLPTIIAELFPVLDLFPTWTAAMLYVTLRRARSAQTEDAAARLTTGRFLSS